MSRLALSVPTSVLVEGGVIRKVWVGSVPDEAFATRLRKTLFPQVADLLEAEPTEPSELKWIEELPPQIRVSVDTLRKKENFPEELARYARESSNRIRGKRRQDESQLYQRLAWNAREFAPANPRVWLDTEWSVRGPIPTYHFPMVRDPVRNDAYDQALRSVVTKDSVVLEVGTGSGVLAMMAARAGAKHVCTCESEPLLVDVARETIARNGLADRITVIPKHSSKLVIGEDIPAPADILLSDHIAAYVMDYGAIPMVTAVKNALVAPGGVILPGMAGNSGVLVGGEPWGRDNRVGSVNGFDLSALNLYSPPRAYLGRIEYRLDNPLCADTEILRVDFVEGPEYPEEERTLTVRAIRDGVAEGFLHWLWVRLTPEIGYDNRPPAVRFREPVLHWFPAPIQVKEGDELTLTVKHDRQTVWVFPA